MTSLIVSIINKTTYKACVLVGTKEMEAYQNDMPIGITKYNSPDTTP